MDFTIPEEKQNNVKDRQILGSCNGTEKVVEREGDSDANIIQAFWNSPQTLRKKTGGIGNQRKN